MQTGNEWQTDNELAPPYSEDWRPVTTGVFRICPSDCPHVFMWTTSKLLNSKNMTLSTTLTSAKIYSSNIEKFRFDQTHLQSLYPCRLQRFTLPTLRNWDSTKHIYNFTASTLTTHVHSLDPCRLQRFTLPTLRNWDSKTRQKLHCIQTHDTKHNIDVCNDLLFQQWEIEIQLSLCFPTTHYQQVKAPSMTSCSPG